MIVRYMCLKCGQKIKVDSSMVGQETGCPNCKHWMQVPPPTQADVSAALAELRQQRATGVAPAATGDPQYEEGIVHIKNKVKKVRTWRGSMYMFFIVASLPLFLAILFEEKKTISQRLESTINALPKKEQARAMKVYKEYKRDEADIDEVLQVLPDRKITGAWLPLYNKWHYHFTGAAAIGYLILLGLLFPQGFARFHVKIAVMLFTGVAGMALLYLIQDAATSGRGVLLGGPLGFLFALIGIAYNVVDMPDVSFGTLLMANTIGVGLCEELVKALPVFYVLMGRNKLSWHECASLGMASGLGFGIVEAFEYGHMYHGLHDQLTYWVRFVSCIISHGISTAAAALMLHRFQGLLSGHLGIVDALLRMLLLISVPMCLHGLYNTLASKQMEGMALAVDLFNFAWFAVMVETARDKEGDMTVEISDSATADPGKPG